MSFNSYVENLTEWYPEFIKDRKNKDTGKIEQVLSDNNKKNLMSLGITKNSTLEEIPMKDAKISNDLILFRNKAPNPKHPHKIWIGYKHGTTYQIYLPSELKATAAVVGLNRLYFADQAFKVTIEPKAKVKVDKREAEKNIEFEDKESNVVNKYYLEQYKNKIKSLIDTNEKNIFNQLDKWSEDTKYTKELNFKLSQDFHKTIIKYIDTILSKSNSSNSPLVGPKPLNKFKELNKEEEK